MGTILSGIDAALLVQIKNGLTIPNDALTSLSVEAHPVI